MSIDYFELAKDITRAHCEREGYPAPDNKPASIEAHALMDATNREFAKEFGALPDKPQRTAINTGMSCQIIERAKP